MRYAISDIHGCYDTFNALLGKLNLAQNDEIYILGDMIDRGKKSWEVLKRIESIHCKCTVLKGNHEDMMISAFENPENDEIAEIWALNGGTETIRSIPKQEARKWVEWMKKLPLFLELEDYFLVHANFHYEGNPFIEESMLWSRVNSPKMSKPIIGGHTPTKIEKMIKQSLGDYKIVIDNGCCFNQPGYNSLVAFCLEDRKIIAQENIEND